MFTSKNAISPVIAVILLLAITVVISMSMYSFLEDYTQSTTSSLTSSTSLDSIKVNYVNSEKLFLTFNEPFQINSLIVKDNLGNNVCSFNKNQKLNSEGLVAHWSFDEIVQIGLNQSVIDLSGNGNTGTLFDLNGSNSDGNTLPYIFNSENYGNGLYFDGVDDYVEVLDNDILDLDSDLTIMYLIDVNTVNEGDFRTIVSKTVSSSYSSIITSDLEFGFFAHNSSVYNQIRTKPNSVDERFYFIVVTKNSNGMSLYINFDKINTTFETPQSITTNNYNLCIGRDAGPTGCNEGISFGGIIYDLKMFNRSISESEMLQNYLNLVEYQDEGFFNFNLEMCNLQQNKKYKLEIIGNGKKISEIFSLN